jgi:hypothetical protein
MDRASVKRASNIASVLIVKGIVKAYDSEEKPDNQAPMPLNQCNSTTAV